MAYGNLQRGRGPVAASEGLARADRPSSQGLFRIFRNGQTTGLSPRRRTAFNARALLIGEPIDLKGVANRRQSRDESPDRRSQGRRDGDTVSLWSGRVLQRVTG
jgi:hypothetical protein